MVRMVLPPKPDQPDIPARDLPPDLPPEEAELAALLAAEQAAGEEPSEASDRSLLVRFRRGEQDAATALYMRYARRLASLARKQTSVELATRFDPEDVVQSVFRTFFRRASQGLYDVPAGEELWRLFLVISLHKIRELAAFHRAAKRDVATTTGSADLERSLKYEVGRDDTALGALQQVIDELLGELPATQKQIVELRIAGHDVDSIVQQTQRAKRTVERTLQQFRQRLREMLEEH